MTEKGIIFDIQHFAVHDGPGIRTLVFFKGCPLNCHWCCNPESKLDIPQVKFISFRCNQCLDCIGSCDYDAIQKFEDKVKIDFNSCYKCNNRKCIDACNFSAIQEIGKTYTVAQVMEFITKDIAFYRNSGGGVTFSGGEPLNQPDFLIALLKECKKQGIHTAIETTGYAKSEIFLSVAENVDLFLFDIKIINNQKHSFYTDVEVDCIHENLKSVVAMGKEIIVRLPLIPGITDTDENLKEIIKLCKRYNLSAVHLEPYNSLGISKYEELGQIYKLPDIKEYLPQEVDRILNLFLKNGIACEIA